MFGSSQKLSEKASQMSAFELNDVETIQSSNTKMPMIFDKKLTKINEDDYSQSSEPIEES